MDEADAPCLGGIDAAGSEQQLLGVCSTDRGEELAQAGERIGEAEAGRGQREGRALGGDSDIAGKRQGEAAADAVAVDNGEDRLRLPCRAAKLSRVIAS